MTNEQRPDQARDVAASSPLPDDIPLDHLHWQGRLSARAVHALARERIYTVGELRAKRASLHTVRYFGVAGLREVDGLLDEPLASLTTEAQPPYLLGRFEDDFIAAARATLTPPVAWILVRRWGLDGDAPATLAVLGVGLGISRERVRQLQVSGMARARALIAEANRARASGELVRSWGAVAEHLEGNRAATSPPADATPSPAGPEQDTQSARMAELMRQLDVRQQVR